MIYIGSEKKESFFPKSFMIKFLLAKSNQNFFNRWGAESIFSLHLFHFVERDEYLDQKNLD